MDVYALIPELADQHLLQVPKAGRQHLGVFYLFATDQAGMSLE